MPASLGRVVGVLFFFINLTPQAYCTTACGLKIDLSGNLGTENNSDAPTQISDLTQLTGRAHTSTIEENVSYTLYNDESSADIDIDTDDEEEASSEDEKNDLEADRKLETFRIVKNAKPSKYNWSRNSLTAKDEAYVPKNNYLKIESAPNKLRTQLSQEALTIVGSEPSSQTQKSTVCLCVALRDKRGYVKKFVFHNGANVLPLKMRKKAEELGYDVIKAEQSHAEGQLIQFLLRRHQVRPGWYTHIMGMGCSKCHCAECDCLFKLFLGEGYHAVTASVDDKKDGVNNPVIISVESKSEISASDETDADEEFIQTTITIKKYKVVKGEEAIDSAIYDNYYLPENLKKEIQRRAGSNFDWSNDRFNKKKEETKSRKRNN